MNKKLRACLGTFSKIVLKKYFLKSNIRILKNFFFFFKDGKENPNKSLVYYFFEHYLAFRRYDESLF